MDILIICYYFSQVAGKSMYSLSCFSLQVFYFALQNIIHIPLFVQISKTKYVMYNQGVYAHNILVSMHFLHNMLLYIYFFPFGP